MDSMKMKVIQVGIRFLPRFLFEGHIKVKLMIIRNLAIEIL